MKVFTNLLIIACALVSTSETKECFGQNKESREYKRKVAQFNKEINNNKPTMFNLIKISNNSGLSPEELISIIDKDDSCDLDEQEMLAFLDRWAIKKHSSLSDETKHFEHRAFNFIDDDHDGVILGREILPAQRTANDYAYLGSAAESLFGYF